MRAAVALSAVLAIATASVIAVGQAASPSSKPPIAQSRIPFGPKRKAEMRRYARRHYGIDRYTLEHPRVIVEHFTGTTSYRATYQTFAADVPDVELHELPGVCAHFVSDRH